MQLLINVSTSCDSFVCFVCLLVGCHYFFGPAMFHTNRAIRARMRVTPRQT